MLVSEQFPFWLYLQNWAGSALWKFLYLKMALMSLIRAQNSCALPAHKGSRNLIINLFSKMQLTTRNLPFLPAHEGTMELSINLFSSFSKMQLTTRQTLKKLRGVIFYFYFFFL